MFEVFESAVLDLNFHNVKFQFVPSTDNNKKLSLEPIVLTSKKFNKELCHYHTCNNNSFLENEASSEDLLHLITCHKIQRSITKNNHTLNVTKINYLFNTYCHISIQTYINKDNFALVSFLADIKEDDDECRTLDKRTQNHCKKIITKNNLTAIKTIQKMSLMFSEHLLNTPDFHKLLYNSFVKNLSSTEKQVLYGLISGYPLKQIAGSIGRDYKYLSNFILPSIKKNFGKDVTRDRLFFELGANRLDLLMIEN